MTTDCPGGPSDEVPAGNADPCGDRTWYDTAAGKGLYWSLLLATLLGVGLSATAAAVRIPPVVYLFGFLGTAVAVFTNFARQFGDAGRFRLAVLSRTVGALPLVAGVYLLAFAFPGTSGELSTLAPSVGAAELSSADRAVAGLSFLTGVYVGTTLRALGRLAGRLLGVPALVIRERN